MWAPPRKKAAVGLGEGAGGRMGRLGKDEGKECRSGRDGMVPEERIE